MKRKKILVMDDDEITLTVVSELLRKGSRSILVSSDSVEGLQMAQAEKPDLIVLDVYMPSRNGWSVLSELRSLDATRHTPVLILTSESEAQSVDLAREMGVSAYLIKPVDGDVLRRKVDEVLAGRPAPRGEARFSASPS